MKAPSMVLSNIELRWQMTFFDATEQAYKNGYEQGRKDAAKCGQWIFSKDGLYWTCSECKVISLEHTRYCPECGAKMSLEG